MNNSIICGTTRSTRYTIDTVEVTVEDLTTKKLFMYMEPSTNSPIYIMGFQDDAMRM